MRDTGVEREEEQATLQPAVTLMTPFITMCRLTSWQRHAAPDGGEGHITIPTLRSSFVAGHWEGACNREENEGIVSCIGAQLDWHCTGSALLAALVLVLDSRWPKLWPDLAISKTLAYHATWSRKTLTSTPVQFSSIPIEMSTPVCLITN